jgi:hypothetical protein
LYAAASDGSDDVDDAGDTDFADSFAVSVVVGVDADAASASVDDGDVGVVVESDVSVDTPNIFLIMSAAGNVCVVDVAVCVVDSSVCVVSGSISSNVVFTFPKPLDFAFPGIVTSIKSESSSSIPLNVSNIFVFSVPFPSPVVSTRISFSAPVSAVSVFAISPVSAAVSVVPIVPVAPVVSVAASSSDVSITTRASVSVCDAGVVVAESAVVDGVDNTGVAVIPAVSNSANAADGVRGKEVDSVGGRVGRVVVMVMVGSDGGMEVH